MSGRISACRSCGSPDLHLALSLGAMPLANALPAPEQLAQPDARYPLDLVFCPRCTLVQITETVPPETLFREYLYFSSYSETMLQHARALAARCIEARSLDARSLVVELGSNDGYLLQYFAGQGIPVLGIEPARNVAAVANARGIRTLGEFFGTRVAEALRQERPADLLVANNVLAHVADHHDVLEGIRLLLDDDGVAVIEVPYVKDMIDRCEFDTIYHEHLCYFSGTALARLLEPHRLIIADVQRIPVHGGSLRITAAHQDRALPSPAVQALLADEAAWGVHRLATYSALGEKASSVRASLRALVSSLKQDGRRLAAYGAAAKATVMLNYCGIGREILDFVVDRSPHKQGRFVPGVRVPIAPPARLLADRPDYTLLLAWNLTDEVLEQETSYRHAGGRFIVPIPNVRVV
jgi:SAM-dependent methyltransferase